MRRNELDHPPLAIATARLSARRARFGRFDEFWIAYVRVHSNPKTAGLHILGVLISVVLLALMLSCGMVFFAVIAVVPAKVFAWLGHWLTGEDDTVSPSRPDWAAAANVRMFWLAMTGRLEETVRAVNASTSRG